MLENNVAVGKKCKSIGSVFVSGRQLDIGIPSSKSVTSSIFTKRPRFTLFKLDTLYKLNVPFSNLTFYELDSQ